MRRAFPVLAALWLSSVASAHEFWIEPTTVRAAVGEGVGFRLLIGDGFPGEPYVRNPEHLRRFEILGPDGAAPVGGLTGDDPAGAVRLKKPGVFVVVYHSHPNAIELPAAKFEPYLASVGLEHITALRASRGMSAAPGRESYSRCAKTLVAVDGRRGGHERAAGLPLELIPEDDPFALEPGGELEVRALLHGEPVAGLLLQSFERETRGPIARVRTDAEGRARFELRAAGSWMISGVHMVESTREDADWESLWSSLTFTVSEPEAGRSPE